MENVIFPSLFNQRAFVKSDEQQMPQTATLRRVGIVSHVLSQMQSDLYPLL